MITLLACAASAFYFIRWNFVNAVAGNGLDAKIPEARSVADWLPETSPGDPQAHLAAARYFERTFEPDDLERSLAEYKTAVDLAPNNYDLWVYLARARDRAGDSAGAEAAFERAYSLAPNYSSVRWAYGNSLIRHGQIERGFTLIAEAAQADIQYRGQAVVTALQIFGNDPNRAGEVLGSTPGIDAALTDVLAAQKRFRDAAAFWSRVPAEDKIAKFKDVGQRLTNLAETANEFRIAARVAGDLLPEGVERPEPGRITNGGFENEIRLRNATRYEWQIGEGTEPQIGLNESMRRSGRYSLFLTFNSFAAAESFRSISQTVGVEPGAVYEFTGYYRAELKTKAEFRWEIVDAINSVQIAITEPLQFAGDWTTMQLKFTVPPSTDGITVRLVRHGCGIGACPVTGKLAFDDLALTR